MNISVKNDFSICTVHFFSWDTYLTFQLKVKDLGKFNGLTNSSIWQLCGRDFQHFSFSTFQMNRQMLFLAVVASIMSLLVAQVVSHPGVNPYPNPLSQQDRKVSTTCSSEKICHNIVHQTEIHICARRCKFNKLDMFYCLLVNKKAAKSSVIKYYVSIH